MARPRGIPALTAVLLAVTVLAQSTDGPRNDLPQPYATTRDWGQLPPGVKRAAVTAVEPAPDGAIYVVHRCVANSCAGRPEAPILKYDATGTLLQSFGEGLLIFPHGATVDRDGHLWVTDAGGENGKGHQVFQFSSSGQVLMTLGQAGISGSGPGLFDQPTDVAVSASGDIFVTDSHRNGKNNRVVKFRKDGTFVLEWGQKGSGPGELSEPHTIAVDSQGRLFVGDRENNRIQIFDQEGRYLDQWRQFGRPSGIFITRDDTIYVTDSESGPDTGAHERAGIKKGIRIGSARDGRVTMFIEDSESTAPDHSGAEGVGVDAQGNVYGAVVRRQMLERHAKKADVETTAAQARPTAAREFPMFQVDPAWPTIPNNWQLGQVASVSIDAQDHVWVLQRPGTLSPEEKSRAAPPLLEFDASGAFIQAWGGPGPGYEWPSSEHGVYVDPKGFVWIGGNGAKDSHVLKFTRAGTFVMQIGLAGQSKGNADTQNLNQPADTFVYGKTNELFVADGYGNRRVIVFDADTDKFKRMWGAFGNVPTDASPKPCASRCGRKRRSAICPTGARRPRVE